MEKKYIGKSLTELIKGLIKDGYSRKEIIIYLLKAEGATPEQAENIVNREMV